MSRMAELDATISIAHAAHCGLIQYQDDPDALECDLNQLTDDLVFGHAAHVETYYRKHVLPSIVEADEQWGMWQQQRRV